MLDNKMHFSFLNLQKLLQIAATGNMLTSSLAS